MKTRIGILSFFLSIAFFGLLTFKPNVISVVVPSAYAQTEAALLPNAVQQYFDNNGNPLSSGKVYFYEVGTTTFKDTYTSSAATTVNANPITLNAGGKAPTGGIYGIGQYRQIVRDRNGNLIWDAVTEPGGGSADPTLVGDGNLVGTVLPWSGLVAPNQYVFAYGQEIARATYSDFYTAITQQLNVICTSASNILTGVSDTTQIKIGSAVELSLCVPAGTTVVSKTAATITLSNPSSVSINSTATFFPWGNGNGTTTFNVPDLRGYTLAGRDNMGGTASSRLTTTYFNPAGTSNPAALGATGGSQSHTMTISELATHDHGGLTGNPTTNPNLSSTFNFIGDDNTASTGSGRLSGTQFNPTLPNHIHTISPNGYSEPFTIIQPTITINYVVKVTPDTSTSIATGVYSIGGMSGVISCGSGLLCTGNIISVNASTFAGGSDSQVQVNSSGLFAGYAGLTFISPNNLTVGISGSSAGLLDITGSTSGRIRQTAQAVAGTPTITWGNSSGTPSVVATSPLLINSITGTVSISPNTVSKTDDTNVTLTFGGDPSNAVISPLSLTLGWSGQLAVLRGGTGLGSGTSGGVPYFNSGSTMASSAELGANQLVIGGGAGAAPSTFACATSTTVVHGGTPPTCSQIINADITTNTISNDRLQQIAAATLKGNYTASTATPIDFTIGSLTQTVSPGALDWLLIFDDATGTFKKVNAASIASATVAGVASLNGLTGALSITGSAGIVTNSSGTTITITPDTATASNFFTGTAAKLLDANVVFSSETNVTYGATTNLDFNTFINSRVTLTGNVTLTCSNIKAGQAGTIALIQDGTGSRVITPNSAAGWCSQFKFAGATIPTLTTSASAVDILSYSCRSSTYCAVGLSKGYNP